MTEKKKEPSHQEILIAAQKELWHRQRKLKPGQARDAGPHGKTRELILDGIKQRFSKKGVTRYVAANEAKEARDRSLSGKARRKARKGHNKQVADKVNAGEW